VGNRYGEWLMTLDDQTVLRDITRLADEYRERCLWFMRDDFQPKTLAEALRILQYIERNGDVAALRKVAPLKKWLLQHTNKQSAD
jgi:uncharacterized protein (DUF3820 family)